MSEFFANPNYPAVEEAAQNLIRKFQSLSLAQRPITPGSVAGSLQTQAGITPTTSFPYGVGIPSVFPTQRVSPATSFLSRVGTPGSLQGITPSAPLSAQLLSRARSPAAESIARSLGRATSAVEERIASSLLSPLPPFYEEALEGAATQDRLRSRTRNYISANPYTGDVFAERHTASGDTEVLVEENDADCVSICDTDLATGVATCVDVCPREVQILDAIMDGGNEPIYLAEEALEGRTTLNGHSYMTGELISYLYTGPAGGTKIVPHTDQVMSDKQAQNVIRMISEGYVNLIASSESDAVYALDEPSDPTLSKNTVVLDNLDEVDLVQAGLVNPHEYYVDAFLGYAKVLGMKIGMKYKQAINFGIARHLNVVGTVKGEDPIMGLDLDIIAFILACEATGLERSPENQDRLVEKLVHRFPIDVEDALLYAVPWAHGMCCVLQPDELALIQAGGLDAIAAIQEEVGVEWDLRGRRPIAAYLSDQEFEQRLQQVDADTLQLVAFSIPIDGDAATRETCPIKKYIIKTSNLSIGAPLAPPLYFSVAKQMARLSGKVGSQPTVQDVTEHQSCIQFVQDCPVESMV